MITWKERVVFATWSIGLLLSCVLLILFVFGASQPPYRVYTEHAEGHTYLVFKASNGSMHVERVE